MSSSPERVTPSRPPRVLIYSQDGMGLGHLRRTHNIAREFTNRASGSEVLVLADSPVAPFFVPVAGVSYQKLPTILKTGDSSWEAVDESTTVGRALVERSGMILDALEDFRPDAVLVDHMPVGALGELRPMLKRVRDMGTRPKLVLGLRDILDEPATIRKGWTRLEAYDYLRLYDKVLIYGCPEIFDADHFYGLTPAAKDISYTNYVVSNTVPPTDTRPIDDPYVLVMGGGGADAFPVAEAFLRAWPAIRQPGLRACILTGPNMDHEKREFLKIHAEQLDIFVPPRKVDAIPWIRQAAAVVTMAGYNSLCEVLRWRRPALVVPRRGPSSEQRMRAKRFEERRIAAVLGPDELTGESLARELSTLLSDRGIPEPTNIPRLDGAARAARAILESLGLHRSELSGEEEDALPTRRAGVNGSAP